MDLEDAVTRLNELKAEENRLHGEYEKLRDEILPLMDGPQFFIDSEGKKRVAFKVDPEKFDYDLEAAEAVLTLRQKEKVIKRSIDGKAFWAEVKAGRISDNQAAAIASLIPGTPHVRFGDPQDMNRRGKG